MPGRHRPYGLALIRPLDPDGEAGPPHLITRMGAAIRPCPCRRWPRRWQPAVTAVVLLCDPMPGKHGRGGHRQDHISTTCGTRWPASSISPRAPARTRAAPLECHPATTSLVHRRRASHLAESERRQRIETACDPRAKRIQFPRPGLPRPPNLYLSVPACRIALSWARTGRGLNLTLDPHATLTSLRCRVVLGWLSARAAGRSKAQDDVCRCRRWRVRRT